MRLLDVRSEGRTDQLQERGRANTTQKIALDEQRLIWTGSALKK